MTDIRTSTPLTALQAGLFIAITTQVGADQTTRQFGLLDPSTFLAPSALTAYMTATQVQQAIRNATPLLGGAAALNVGTTPGTVAAGDDPRITGAQTAEQVAEAIAAAGGVPVNYVENSGAAQVLDPAAVGDICYDVILTGNCAFTLGAAHHGQYQRIILLLRQDATAGRQPGMPAGVKWANGGALPTFDTAAGGIDEVTFKTSDGGTTWLGSY